MPCSDVQQQQRLTNRPSSQTEHRQDEEFQYTKLTKELEQFGKAHLKVGHINITSLMTLSKLLEINQLLETTKFDILGITETELTSKTKDEGLDINRYKFIRKDRGKEDWGGGGGGCLPYYTEDLDLY